MDQRARFIIGTLTVVVLVLAVSLVAVIVADDDDYMPMRAGTGNASMMMMQAMGAMDSDGTLEHMREVLGEDGYQRMLQHFRDHRSGGPMAGSAGIDNMMHQMMDGMMQQMPDDTGRMMPRGTATPSPTR